MRNITHDLVIQLKCLIESGWTKPTWICLGWFTMNVIQLFPITTINPQLTHYHISHYSFLHKPLPTRNHHKSCLRNQANREWIITSLVYRWELSKERFSHGVFSARHLQPNHHYVTITTDITISQIKLGFHICIRGNTKGSLRASGGSREGKGQRTARRHHAQSRPSRIHHRAAGRMRAGASRDGRSRPGARPVPARGRNPAALCGAGLSVEIAA